jgi:alpha-galactosidase
MTSETKDILLNREVLAVDKDPLGRQGRRVAQNGTVEIWAKPLHDGSVAVALFNRGSGMANVSVRWSQLSLKLNFLEMSISVGSIIYTFP